MLATVHIRTHRAGSKRQRQWRREPGRAPGQHNSWAPLPAYPSPRPRKTAKPEGPRGPGAPLDFPFFMKMHYSPETRIPTSI